MNTYREFFGLSAWPFEKEVSAEEIFQSKEAMEAGGRLAYLARTRGIGLVTGEVGSGKTTLVRRFVQDLPPALHKVVFVAHTTGHVLDLLKTLAWEMGASPTGGSRAALFRGIQEEIVRLVEAKRVHPVIVIDEAQALRQHVLEEIRILMNFRMDSVDLATLLFVGQESIARRLSLGVLDPLASRIVMRAHLGGLAREEIGPYLEHRLARAGVTRPLYSEPAIEALARLSKGLPRRLGLIAHHALAAAAVAKAKIVDAEHVQMASKEVIG